MMRSLALSLIAVGALPACTYVTRFDPAHFEPRAVEEAERVDGRVLVMTGVQDDGWVYSGHPSSLTGGGTTLKIPLGEITREAAVRAFAEVFRGGVDRSNHLAGLEAYRVVVAPRTVAYDYEYNALRNLGFAVTPQASVHVEVLLLDARGSPAWQRKYESGPVSGGTYFISADPAGRVARATHQALLAVMRRAAADVRAALAAPPPAQHAGATPTM